MKGKVSSITSFTVFPPLSLASLQVTAAWLNHLLLALKLNRAHGAGERQKERDRNRGRERGVSKGGFL